MAQGGLRGTLTGAAASITNPAVCSGSVAVSIGDLIVAICGQQTNLTVTACGDNLGNSYTAQNAGTDPGSPTARVYYSVATVAGTLTAVNFTTTASTNDWAGLAMVIEGPVGAIDANVANITSDITSPFTCPTSGTLNSANEIVIGWGAANQSTVWAATSPNLLAGNANNSTNVKVALGYQLVTATTAVAPAFTAAANPTVCILGTFSFKAPRLLTATFAGAGSLTADAAIPPAVRDGAATFAGAGVLTASATQIELDFSETFAGAGALTVDATVAAGTTTWSGEATLAGAGALTARGDWVQPLAATFAGAGALAARGDLTLPGTATFAGAGALAARGSLTLPGTATFSGAGAFTAGTYVLTTGAATFAGAGALSADSYRLTTGAATFSGAGALAADTTQMGDVQGSATLAGAGALSADSYRLTTGAATFTGAGAFSAGTYVLTTGAASFAGAGLLVADASQLGSQDGAATFSGAGALAADTLLIAAGAAAFAGAGALAADARLGDQMATAALAGAGTLTVNATVQLDLPSLIYKILTNEQELQSGKFVIYDNDGVTVLFDGNAWADVAGTTPYAGNELRKIDRLTLYQ